MFVWSTRLTPSPSTGGELRIRKLGLTISNMSCLRDRCTGQAEVFDLKADPFQLQNLAGLTAFAKQVQAEFLPLASSLAKCKGASCNRPEPARLATTPLECYESTAALDAPQVSL